MLKIKLPHFSEDAQAKAFKNILRFFAAMLALTLIARGASNAVLPTVSLVNPVATTITQKIDINGEIVAFSAVSVFAPNELLVKSVLVREGEQVNKDQQLAVFDEKETQISLQKIKANIAKLKAEKAQLLQKNTPDKTAVESAQRRLDRAYQSQAAAAETYNAVCADPNADANAISAAKQGVENALADAQDAEYSRNDAIESFKKQETTATLTNATNVAQANLLDIEIAALQEKSKQISDLIKNNYTVLSPENGIVSQLLLQDGKPAQSLACQIKKTDDGLGFQFILDAQTAQKIAVGTPLKITQSKTSEKATVTAITVKNSDEVQITARIGQSFKIGAASAVVELSSTRHDLCLPPQAVNTDNNGTFIYVVEPKNTVLGVKNVCVRISVTAIEQGENHVAVSGAISYNSQIVSTASRPISAGSAVRIEP